MQRKKYYSEQKRKLHPKGCSKEQSSLFRSDSQNPIQTPHFSEEYKSEGFGDKRGQHEIAGFVIIVLLVSIIGVVFLSIAFSKSGSPTYYSAEISNLLESLMYSTTDCAINYIPQYRDMQDLIKECYKDKSGSTRTCLDGRKVCTVLEEDLKKVINIGLNVGENAPNKAYTLSLYYTSRDESSPHEEIISFEKGIFTNCTGIVGGGHSLPVSSLGGGTITTELRVCKN